MRDLNPPDHEHTVLAKILLLCQKQPPWVECISYWFYGTVCAYCRSIIEMGGKHRQRMVNVLKLSLTIISETELEGSVFPRQSILTNVTLVSDF